MAKASRLAPEQLRALDRLTHIAGIDAFYLAGASAIAWHLGHRRSLDLDLFSTSGKISLERIEPALVSVHGISVLDSNEVMLALDVQGVPVDLVRYPYPLLVPTVAGPHGFPVAQPLDLAAMKLSAISRRGLKRDFWDLYELARSGITLPEAARAYVRRFHRKKADLYAVERALTWFEDAERDPVPLRGLTPAKWRKIKVFFQNETPRLLEEL